MRKRQPRQPRKKSIAEAQHHAQPFEGSRTRSRARGSIPETQEGSSPSVTSSDDEPPIPSGKPKVPGETMESHSLSDEDGQEELSESDTSTLLSDSNDEDGKSNVNETDTEDEMQEEPPSVPNHPTPDEGNVNQPTTRPKSGTRDKRADREHLSRTSEGQQPEFSHSSCLRRNTVRNQLRHLVKQGVQQQRFQEERKREAARIAESGGGAAKRKMLREARKLGMSYKSYKRQWAQQRKYFGSPTASEVEAEEAAEEDTEDSEDGQSDSNSGSTSSSRSKGAPKRLWDNSRTHKGRSALKAYREAQHNYRKNTWRMSGGTDRFQAPSEPWADYDNAPKDGKGGMATGVYDDLCELLRRTVMPPGMSFAQTKMRMEANVVSIVERLQQLNPRRMDRLAHTTAKWCAKRGWSLPGRNTSKPESPTRLQDEVIMMIDISLRYRLSKEGCVKALGEGDMWIAYICKLIRSQESESNPLGGGPTSKMAAGTYPSESFYSKQFPS